MAAEFQNLFLCSYGPADFQLTDYTVSESAEVKQGEGQLGTNAAVSGVGYVEGSSPADFAAKLAAVRAAFRAGGRPLFVYGLAGVLEYSLLPAASSDGGPHVQAFNFLPSGDEPALVKRFTFTVGCKVSDDEEDEDKRNKYTVRTQTRPDRLRVVIFEGEIRGTTSTAFFSDVVLPGFRAAYPATTWTLATDAVRNLTETRVEYSAAFTELASPLPPGPAGTEVIDGEVNFSLENDERGRQTIVAAWDLLLVGDAFATAQKLRPTPPLVLLRERIDYTRIHEKRLRATFTTLGGTEGNALLEWEHTLDTQPEGQVRVPFEYAGLTPQFGGRAALYRAVQRGRAVGLQAYIKEPAPLYDAKFYEGPPRVVYRPVNRVECETTWEYQFVNSVAFKVDAGVLKKLQRPELPEVYGG
jgi:hypothetical protein